jgi:hypothetical protein
LRVSGHSLTPFPATACDNLETMLFESDKVMFEIYKETEYTGQYRVVYFTELRSQ